ncbi:SitA5 family polymorphic toxin [Pyxidicoccus xibeiensis]|uniref:SitA5 family polymorphic toxin n=1 Tax=Pyxidicoccus xibeiensis TaxID=2906759 RepID=UPI0020A80145|nr:hypothetical protein [Pyxidicoccus xibeiensis]MCP3142664.1 hypothetical protein [Pyxidicoccus xibeiensis]
MATRLGVVVLLCALLNACTHPRLVRLDTGQGAPLEYEPTSSNKSVRVDAEGFAAALTQLVLDAPLALRAPHQGWLVRATYSGSGADTRWQRLMSKSFGGLCAPGRLRDNCLSLLDDGMGLGEWDKLGVALGLSLEPLKASIAKAVEKTLAPQLFYTVIATGLITWAVLAANPEPVFTKAAAIVSAVLLIYLGVEIFLEVVDASRELKGSTDRATTWTELDQAGQRFANRVGPEVARVFVLAVTMVLSHGMTGGAAVLASRLSLLPRYLEAAAAGASRVGIHLGNVGQVSTVAVEGSTVVISLPATAVAMTARGSRGAAAGVSPVGLRSWGSFSGLRSALGSAGPGKNWHHIVEQTPGNVERFGPHSLHNTENVVAINEGVHRKISAYYSSKDPRFTGGKTVRQWLSGQSFQAQRKFGVTVLQGYGVIP